MDGYRLEELFEVLRTSPIFCAPLVECAMRSSDIRGLSDPFGWMVSRRLGLRKPFEKSSALTRGSWFHTAVRCWGGVYEGAEFDAKYAGVMDSRRTEIADICARLNLGTEVFEQVVTREGHDARTAKAWFLQSRAFPVDGYPSWTSWLTAPHWRWLSFEDRLVNQNRGDPKTKLPGTLDVAQPDLMLYHKNHDKVWLVDFKTTSLPPSERLVSCPEEFQSQHYLRTASFCMTAIREHYGLPTSTTLGGIVHVAVQKPKLEFGRNDRPSTMRTKVLKSGPRKGQTVVERVYDEDSEPSFELYLERIARWYKGVEEFAGTRTPTETPVGISAVSSSVLAHPFLQSVLDARRARIARMLSTESPADFVGGETFRKPGETPDHIDALRSMPPRQWPLYLKDAGFTVGHRDSVPELRARMLVSPVPHFNESGAAVVPDMDPEF